MLILLYGCTTWTLTKWLEKKLDSNYTRMLRAILNKSWRQHPTKQQLYGHLPPITKIIKIRQTRYAGHCWRSRDEFISDVLLWITSHRWAKAGPPAWTNIQRLCADTGCSPEDLLEAMDDREGCRERVRVLMARYVDDDIYILDSLYWYIFSYWIHYIHVYTYWIHLYWIMNPVWMNPICIHIHYIHIYIHTGSIVFYMYTYWIHYIGLISLCRSTIREHCLRVFFFFFHQCLTWLVHLTQIVCEMWGAVLWGFASKILSREHISFLCTSRLAFSQWILLASMWWLRIVVWIKVLIGYKCMHVIHKHLNFLRLRWFPRGWMLESWLGVSVSQVLIPASGI